MPASASRRPTTPPAAPAPTIRTSARAPLTAPALREEQELAALPLGHLVVPRRRRRSRGSRLRAFAISWRFRARNARTNSGSNARPQRLVGLERRQRVLERARQGDEVVEAVRVRPAAAAAARRAARCRRASRPACPAEREVRVRGGRAEAILDVRRVAAPGLDADRDRAVLEAPGDARRRVRALAVALGAVDGRPEEGVQRRPRAPAGRRSPSRTRASARPARRPRRCCARRRRGSCAGGCSTRSRR